MFDLQTVINTVMIFYLSGRLMRWLLEETWVGVALGRFIDCRGVVERRGDFSGCIRLRWHGGAHRGFWE